jgi:Putative MetA-pathway of phenol degradation
MNIPEASSKPGFDWGVGLGFDYITSAKCSLLSTSFSCTSTGSSAFSISPSVMAQYDRLRLEVTVPFVDIEGPGTLSGALGPREIVAQSSGPTQRRSGLGDVAVGAAFILLREGRILPRLEIAGVVKVPTAANDLGTGQTDYGVQITFHRRLLKGLKTFGSIGYQRIGDPNTLQLHDGERATVGLDINYSNWGGGALLDYQKSLFPGVPNSFTVDPYVTLPFIAGIGVQIYTTFALTRLSPNHEVGVRLVL